MSLVRGLVRSPVRSVVRGVVVSDDTDLYANSREELDALLIANGVAEADVVATWDAIWPVLIDPDTGVAYASAAAADNQIYNQGGILKSDIVAAIPEPITQQGNLNLPYSGGSIENAGENTFTAVAWQVDLGSVVIGTIASVTCHIQNFKDSSREGRFLIYSDSGSDTPDTVIASTGSFFDPSTTTAQTWTQAITLGGALNQDKVWIVIVGESTPQFQNRIFYETGASENYLSVELADNTKWRTETDLGDPWTSLILGGTVDANAPTKRLQAYFTMA